MGLIGATWDDRVLFVVYSWRGPKDSHHQRAACRTSRAERLLGEEVETKMTAEHGIGYQTMLKQWLAERLEAELGSPRGGGADPWETAHRAPAGKATDR